MLTIENEYDKLSGLNFDDRTMRKDIYDIALQCDKIRQEKIRISRNKIQGVGVIYTDYDICGDIEAWETNLRALVTGIHDKYPEISNLLQHHIDQYDNDRIMHLGAIEAIVKCILTLESGEIKSKRIFISHSSKDKDIVEKFVDNILQLGVGIQSDDIFCSSIEDMGIRNGEDIRRHIHENIRDADYAFLLISSNYKASEICLNEMGAVWAYDSNVRYYLLPDVDFKEIGWLCDTKKAEKLANAIVLDTLQQELIKYFNLTDKAEGWSRQRECFLTYVNKH